jgi:hypothetical protein
MTHELAHKILQSFGASRTFMQMSLMRHGMPKEQAEEQAKLQAPLLMFDLGLRIGKEIESANSMRSLFGDDFPDFPDFPPDDGLGV